MVKRYTRKLKRGGAVKTYGEPQESALCGKHAINHVLQEEKFIWDPDTPTIYVPPLPDGMSPTEHVKNKDTKINVYTACNEFEGWQKEQWFKMGLDERLAIFQREMAIDTDPKDYEKDEDFKKMKTQQLELRAKYKNLSWEDALKAYTADIKIEAFKTYERLQLEKPCQFDGDYYGNMVVEFFERWGNILGLKGFTTSIGSLYPEYIESMKNILRVQLKKPEFLGVMLSVPGHYTAIVMYDGTCEPTRKDKKEAERTYLYVDSMGVKHKKGKTNECTPGSFKCSTEEELMKRLDGMKNLRAMIFLYGADTADPTLQPCDCEAVRRMNGAAPATSAVVAAAAAAAAAPSSLSPSSPPPPPVPPAPPKN
jgi:hypothetical protein